jgi:ATP synthase protein I
VTSGQGKNQREFLNRLERKRERHETFLREGMKSFWSSVGTMGTVGWSIALPMAAGALFGRWLDGRLDSGYVFMFFFMFVGLGMGCFVVWRMIVEKR